MIDPTIIEENRRRLEAQKKAEAYDPETGLNACGERIAITFQKKQLHLPKAMTNDEEFSLHLCPLDFDRLRMKYDFEFWCCRCATVKSKIGFRNIRLRLNRPQRIILAQLEDMRTSGRPIRAILLKARQCGASTLVQVYMAWIQIMLRNNWNSLICAHLRDTSAVIKGMMTKLFANYPTEYLPDDTTALKLRPFEGSRSISLIDGRNNTITLCSAENPDAARGIDIAMAHLSEVAFWRETAEHDPNDILRSIAGSVAMEELTLVVMESTANGVGNFFHNEWLRAKAGESDKRAVFVPWYEYGIYAATTDYATLWQEMDDYERNLWAMGLTLEQIAWYHAKRREYSSHKSMQAEYPTTDEEAFTSTDRMVFDPEGIELLRADCRPAAAVGDMIAECTTGSKALSKVEFVSAVNGRMKVWKRPAKGCRKDRYVTVVDIGGRSEESDYSVIAVIDRGNLPGDRPEVAAQWRGHTDHDLLAWKAAQIALWYDKALLVVESNTLETEMTEGENSGFILDEIADTYPNMYYRSAFNKTANCYENHIGFHTNRSTKPLIINRHIATLRHHAYTERDHDAANEHITYERRPNGSYAAKEGCHDDILMTRCIGLYVADELTRADEYSPLIAQLKRPQQR